MRIYNKSRGWRDWFIFSFEFLFPAGIAFLMGVFILLGLYLSLPNKDSRHLDGRVITVDSTQYFLEFRGSHTYILKPIKNK